MVSWWKPQCNRMESWLPTPSNRLLVLCSRLQLLELQNSRHMTPGPPQPCSRQRRLLELLCLAVLPSEHSYSDVVPVLEQIHSLPLLRSHLTYAPAYASSGALAHMSLGSMHTTLLDPRSQVDLNSRVDQLTQKVDDQKNLIDQLLRQINLNQGPNLRPRDEERRAHEHAGKQFERSQAG
ncbi:unnamed protein product [Prunus armeniaca]